MNAPRHKTRPGLSPIEAEAAESVRRGYTLVEVLVVVAIIGVLLAILLPALSKARQCAVVTGELSAGRQLIAAYGMYCNDNKGWLPVGYATSAMVSTGGVIARDADGRRLTDSRALRYPWRLATYLDNSVEVMTRDLEQIRADADGDAFLYDYGVSLAPRFGLNQVFVGGSAETVDPSRGWAFSTSAAVRQRTAAWGDRWYARRNTDAVRSSELLVFASSTGVVSTRGDDTFDGHYRVDPPAFTGRVWQTSAPNESTAARLTGYASFRFAGKTVATMLDGSARTLSWAEAQDMRRWAPQATSETWMLP